MPAGDYSVLRQLGKGSFGRVFLVQCVHDSSLWVMKEIDLAASGDPKKAQADALKEVGMLSRLDHPNIVKYKECFQSTEMLTPPPAASPTSPSSPSPSTPPPTLTPSSTIMYIIMEYADAGDLNHLIRGQRKPLPESHILAYFTQLSLAIKHLHDRKCLHRDIKSEKSDTHNTAERITQHCSAAPRRMLIGCSLSLCVMVSIFLTSEQRIKLGDFGISKLLPSTFACAITRIGTPYYLSPEICMNRPYNTASDMWSLGVCLYEMCMLAHPFDATSMEGLLKKIVRVPHRPIHNFYHPDLRALCDALMNKNPTKRPSISEVLRVPLIHKEIGKWLTKKQIEQEFLLGGIPDRVDQPLSPLGDHGEGRKEEREVKEKEAAKEMGKDVKEVAAPKVVSSRPASSGSAAKKKDDDTLQWLLAAEEKMKAQEEKRRQLADAKAVVNGLLPARPLISPAPVTRLQAAVDKWDAAQEREEKQQPMQQAVTSGAPPPALATDLSPIPTTILSPSPRTKPLPDVITGSQPSSPTQSKRDLHSLLASQPPSPTHKPPPFRMAIERKPSPPGILPHRPLSTALEAKMKDMRKEPAAPLKHARV